MTNELVHWGIKGQKWGVRRYQNPDGTLTPEGRKRYLNPDGSLNEKGKKKIDVGKYEYIKNNKDVLKIVPDDNPATYEERKQAALKSGTAGDVLKFKGDLTNQEMQTALTRISLERQLSDINSKEIAAGQKQAKSALDKASEIMDKADKVRNMTEKGINIYNTIAKINNSLNEEELPTIGDKSMKTKMKEAADKKAKEAREKELRNISVDDFLKNTNKWSNQEIKDFVTRNKNLKNLKDDNFDTASLSRDEILDLIREELEKK